MANRRMKNKPERQSETILFAVTGMSPAILTETVWALAHENPPVIPNRVVVLTTTVGRETVLRELFTPSPDFGGRCVWDTLRTALERKGLDVADRLAFGATGEDIRVFVRRDSRNNRSTEIQDIVSPEDNAAAADAILQHLRSFTENADVHIVASIAGGRKTMGALLFACMTLIGRETDRLTHVLVSEPFEQPLKPKFYFPTQPAAKLVSHQGRAFNARDARITLADIPFVPLRNRFTDIGRMPGGYNNLVRQYSRELRESSAQPVRVQFDDARRLVSVNGVSVRFRRRAYLTLRFLVEVNQTDQVPAGHTEAEAPMKEFLTRVDPEWAENFSVDPDLKHELSYIRSAMAKANLAWMPGARKDSLRLPPFKLLS